ncbi:indole-3-glycerol phosphate synthase TrpC [Halorhodospira abdelmalekii]|uniref:indole-3-glycerol phosphate synthase TrpC n=1 Tax=Halorhodospira abdelmalekii TaxID=421629 RepID=UPI0030840CCD
MLRQILRRKAEEVSERAARRSLRELSAQVADLPPPRGFRAALAETIAAGQAAVIAELKRASPSRGVLRQHYDPPAIAQAYERAGASCLSVLTDSDYFGGHERDLEAARAAVSLPVLRKDFIVDTYQVYETRALGADCLLLIVAALGDAQLAELHALAAELGLDVLIEVHDATELERVQALGPGLVGINNRDLRTFVTDLGTTERLAPDVPQGALTVCESGIQQPHDIARMRAAGVHAFLVGEAFMTVDDPGERLAALF